MKKSIQGGVVALTAVLMLMFSLGAFADESEKNTMSSAHKEVVGLAGADIWRMAKDGQAGYTTSKSPEHNILISPPGPTWLLLKEKWMSPLGALAIFGSLAMVACAYFIVGPIKLSQPKTGRKIQRWSRVDRTLHWSMAFTFITLALSGLIFVYGKHFIKPIVPTEVWGMTIYACKQYHNYIGPIFLLLLMAMLLKWWPKSVFNMVDVKWVMKFGGMIGKHKGSHPSAGFSNGGEKLLFWLLIWFGVVAAVSGLILDFPMFGQTRRGMELSNLVHMFAALILICGFIFHIYIGLVGMEASLESMVTGEVDETWAKEHHDLWYEEVKHLPENQPQTPEK